jgi:hypothetical protein
LTQDLHSATSQKTTSFKIFHYEIVSSIFVVIIYLLNWTSFLNVLQGLISA